MTENNDVLEADEELSCERDELRQRNLKWFSEQFQSYYQVLKDYTPLSELVEEEDGGTNLSFSGQQLYSPSANECIEKQLDAFRAAPHRLNMYPPQPENFDKYAANASHTLIERIHGEGIEFSAYTPSTKSYYLFVFGFGLGGHIERLVEETDCQCLIIVEPNLEFIAQSLKLFDWQKLHDVIDERGGYLNIINSDSSDRTFERFKADIRINNPCSLDGAIMFTNYNNVLFADVIRRIKTDSNLILSGLGFYFDETVMIANTHENLRSGDARMVRFSEGEMRSYPAFIVASGPSLDKDIEWIKANQENGVVFACGSAIMPLLRNGIQPDFQVEIENIPELYDMMLDTVKYVDVSKAHLLTTSTVDARVPGFFDDVSYFFRPALASYPIFARPEDVPMDNGSPTVTNAALALAQRFGFRELFLFGADMGSKVDGLAHSKHAWQNTDEGCEVDIKFNVPVRGNFGGTVYSYPDMNWTRSELELAIKFYHGGRFYYNCSDGAFIKGTIARHAKSIKLKPQPKKKEVEVKNIVKSFAEYPLTAFEEHWNDEHMRDSFTHYCGRLLECFEDIDDVSSKRALTEINKVLYANHKSGLEVGLAMTFRGTVWQALLAMEYYVNRVDGEEQRATADQIYQEEIVRLVTHLRDTAVADLGHLSEQKWAPRERILDVEREEWDTPA